MSSDRWLPNFFVIGAPRSGTTSTYEYLRAHPDVYMSPVKEPDFFADAILDRVHPLGAESGESLETIATSAAELAAPLERYMALFDGADNQTSRGEASAVYLAHPTAVWHLHTYVPDAKFVAILRDPAERAYSHFVHASRIYAEHGRKAVVGAEGRSVDEEFSRAIDAALANGMPQCTKSDAEVWIRSGFYSAHLTRWWSLIPREQVLVRRFEDLETDENEFVKDIYGFLGIDASFALPTTEAFNASVVPRSRRLFSFFTTKNPLMRHARRIAPARVRALAMRTRNRYLASAKPTLDPQLRAKLVDVYRDDITSLQDLLGWDLSSWLRSEPGPAA